MTGNDQSVGVRHHFNRVAEPLQRYVPVVYGWAGMIFVAGWMFFNIEMGWLVAAALANSFLMAIYGHHALAMGWYDE